MTEKITDVGHVPHGTHYHEDPSNPVHVGPDGISVSLLDWGPNNATTFEALWCALQANWGDGPYRPWHTENPAGGMTEEKWAYVAECFEGRTLQQALERFTFSFLINGVTRACTHQIVRTRLGAGFMQHGGRDNDWRHRAWTMPETIARASKAAEGQDLGESEDGLPLAHCVWDFDPIQRLCESTGSPSLAVAIQRHLQQTRELYAAMVDAGIPWQDARRVLPIGMQTYIFADYNYLGLKGVLANRLEHVMDWEINCVAQLMLREIRANCPEIMWRPLKSHSDRAQRAMFENMDSWPPDGKYPVSHDAAIRQRTHSFTQMPFWVLDPESMAGGPVRWIATNGTYPHDIISKKTNESHGGER